jgi:photosystem II stability/assembly factor-like uncharacterized protein
LYFFNKDTGWICGTGLKVFKTTNGGSNITSTPIPLNFCQDIKFINQTTGFICSDGAGFIRTTNSGTNWVEITLPVGSQLADFEEISIVNDSLIWMIGESTEKVYKSSNYGLTFDSLTRIQGAEFIYTVNFTSKDTGYCGGGFGRIFKTTNGGYNWIQQQTSQFTEGFIAQMFFVNNTTGWGVGAATKISHVKLIVYDITGRIIEKLLEETKDSGEYEFAFDGSNLSSGIYFYSLIIEGNKFDTKRMILIK